MISIFYLSSKYYVIFLQRDNNIVLVKIGFRYKSLYIGTEHTYFKIVHLHPFLFLLKNVVTGIALFRAKVH